MRILHALNSFPPHSRAGSENYVETLALEQRRRHDVSILHRVSEPERPEYQGRSSEWRDLPVYSVNRTFRDVTDFRETYASEPLAAAVHARFEHWRPDVVHFHHVSCLSTTSIEAARALGAAVVFTLHDYWLSCPRGQRVRRDSTLCREPSEAECVNCMAAQLRIRGGFARTRELWHRSERFRWARFARQLVRRWATRPFSDEDDALRQIRERTAHVHEVARSVDAFISPSRWLRDEFVAQGFDAEQIRVLPNGFDTRSWPARALPRTRTDNAPLRVVYLGTWIPTKGVHLLVEAAQAFDASELSLDIHGMAVPYEGADDYEAQLRSAAHGHPHIRFHERYEPDAVPQLLDDADIVVVPSTWYENSPLTVHEAFLAGVPVVASDHGGLRELVHDGHNGLTFRPGDPAALRSVLRRLVDRPEELEQLRRNIPTVTDIADHAVQLESLYGELRDRRREPTQPSTPEA